MGLTMTIIYIALGLSLFILSAGFAVLCHNLKED